MKKVLILAIAVVAFGFLTVYLFASQKEEKVENLEKVRVQAGWLLNGEFSNVCSAIVNGYYKEQGLDVELLPGGPSGASFTIATNAIVQDDSLTLGIDGDIIPLLHGKDKQEEDKVKAKIFASFWNENPYGFMIRKDENIVSIKDLVTKRKADGSKYKIGVTADSVIQYAISQYTNVPVEEMDIVIVGFDATPFLAGQVDAIAGYWTTQAYEIEKAGVPYAFLSASEIPGFDQPSMVAVATDKVLAEKEDTLVKWLKATIKGSQYTIENPTVAAENILDERCGGASFNKEQEEWLIRKSIPLFDKDKIGKIYPDQINSFAKNYQALKQIKTLPSESELIDNSVLTEVYGE